MDRGDGKLGRCFASVTGPLELSCSGGRVGCDFWGAHASRVLAMASRDRELCLRLIFTAELTEFQNSLL